MELTGSLESYFRDEVDLACKQEGLPEGSPTQPYLVGLLAAYAAQPIEDRPLGLKLLNAMGASPRERRTHLRSVGDTSLFVCGFWGESLGRGLVDVFSFLSMEPACRSLIRPETAAALATQGPGTDPAATISHRAMAGADPVCEMALSIFCSVLGATAGNLGLMLLATGGVFVAGGIAPRILSYLQKGAFREAFDRKGRLHTMVEKLPAYVVTHPQPGLLGAAKVAMSR